MKPYRNRMPKWKIKFAREMRNNPTKAEFSLWQSLRKKRVEGYKFVRQRTMLGYIADFYCPALKLVIEVDGSVHESTKKRDQIRDKAMTDFGFRVLRVTNEDVFERKQEIIEKIKSYI